MARIQISNETKTLADSIYNSLKSQAGYRKERLDFIEFALLPMIKNQGEFIGSSLDTLLSNMGDLDDPKIKGLKDDILIVFTRNLIGKERHKEAFSLLKVAELVQDTGKRNELYFEIADHGHEMFHYCDLSANINHYCNLLLDALSSIKPVNDMQKETLRKACADYGIESLVKRELGKGHYERALKAMKLIYGEEKVKKVDYINAALAHYKPSKDNDLKSRLFSEAKEKLKIGELDNAIQLFKLSGTGQIVKAYEQQNGKEQAKPNDASKGDNGLAGLVKDE